MPKQRKTSFDPVAALVIGEGQVTVNNPRDIKYRAEACDEIDGQDVWWLWSRMILGDRSFTPLCVRAPETGDLVVSRFAPC